VHHDIREPLSGNKELQESTKGVEVVFHAAALAYVGESFERPSDYALTNVVGTQNVLNWMLEQGVRALVFTSSCSVLRGSQSPIKEEDGFSPLSPYAATKLSNEKQIELWAKACGGSYGVARFFNVAGVFRGLVGDQHDPEPHLIPRVVASIVSNSEIVVNGNDFQTPDGSAIRDYVHIEDLVDGLLSLMSLCHAGKSGVFNLGSGTGHSVLDVVRSAERVIGNEARITFGPRRPGDAPQLVADVSAARSALGFNPTRSDLVSMLREQLNLY
jgi:UDP-glucose 4-epimerase